MYTTLWEVYPGISGAHSGVYKSADAGKTWEPCKNGLPSGPHIGRISVSVSFTNPAKAYALVDNLSNAKDQAAELYKTLDGGLTWTKTHTGPFKIFSLYGWYFTNVYVNVVLSTSLAWSVPVLDEFWSVVKDVGLATGASFTAPTVMSTVAVAESTAPSFTLKVKLSLPW